MFKNYIKTAIRNLLRQKGSSLLNVAGLTLGLTCSMVLFLMIRYLTSFDNYHQKRDRIYRIVTQMDSNDDRFYTAGVPAVLPNALREDFPEVEEVTFLSYRSGDIVRIPEHGAEPMKFQEGRGIVFAEPSFFRIFDRPVIDGDPSKALDEPHEAIISRSLARKYFGTEDAIGRIVRHDAVDYTIRAVMEDAPDNTDFPFTLMLSYITIRKVTEEGGWNHIWSDQQCYALLKEGETYASVMDRMPAFVKKYLGDDNYNNETYEFQPLKDIHFDARYSNFNYSTTPREVLMALAVVAVFLIVTACINFVNLTTAEAIKRSKEVGIRKTLGSTRGQLTFQFLGETTFVTVFAMLLSLGLAQLALGLLNPYLDLQLALDLTRDVSLWMFILLTTVFVSLFSGLYPSMVLSGYKPALALKNQINNRSASGYHLRRSLVVVQFVISQFFIMGTIVLLSQMNYFRTWDLGFRKDAVFVVPIPERDQPGANAVSSKRTLRDEIARLPGVDQVSLASTPPSSGSVNSTGFYFEGESERNSRDIEVKRADSNYISLYDIRLVAGRNLDDRDTAAWVVVNEAFMRVSGLNDPNELLGRTIIVWDTKLTIVGVVHDFHTASLHQRIEPTILMNNLNDYETLSVRFDGSGGIQNLISEIKSKWESIYPDHIFEYEFLDESIREFYEAEEKMSVLLTIFTSMAVFIGCLGLFGLASFMANQKTKEIGVRKVLGASAESIILLFSKEYVKLIFIGFILSSPAAWFLMNKWLETFAYKITIGPLVFIAAFVVTLVIALVTVGYKSFRAAMANPVRSLRYE